MGHFYQDNNGNWWFKTVGKGNKLRDIAVSDDMLSDLKRYRQSQDYPSYPHQTNRQRLYPKKKAKGL